MDIEEYENFKNRYLQHPITFLTEENLDKLETHCRKAIHYERGVEHKVVLELLERYEEFLAKREQDKKRIKELEEKSIDIAETLYKERMANAVMSNNINGYQEALENSISKDLLKEELERAEKENKPYEEYEIESRMYWINQGKISLAKKLLEDK